MRWVILRFSSQFISALFSPSLTNNELMTARVISPSQITYYSTCTTPLCSVVVLRRPAAPAHPHWSLQCDRYKSIDIEVSISISILLRQSIDIGIDDTFKAGIDIEYRRYFW